MEDRENELQRRSEEESERQLGDEKMGATWT